MAVQFNVPSSPARSVSTISTFLGADFTNSPAAVSEAQSPNCINMIRDVPGKVRKCMGYHTINDYKAKINGFHYIHGETDGVVHAGTKLYKDGAVIFEGMNDDRSKSWQFEGKLYIVDGKQFLVYDGEKVEAVTQNAYIPTLTIAKRPSSGGTAYEPLNLLSAGFTELFAGTASDTAYHLSFGGLDAKTVEVKILNSAGEWVNKKEDVDFKVDRANGIVNFTTVPGVSPLTGEDNVKITAYRTVEGYAEKINKCTIGIQYGINGALDRLFLSGNPDFVNYDWYSQQFEPSYFPDTGYSIIGTSRSKLVGYSIINNYIAAHKDDMEKDQCIILREGALINSEPSFRIVGTLQGVGAIAKDTFCYLGTEPLYLTRSGIHAVTTPDSGEKYSQNRSYYLNGKLLKEQNMENAFACVYNDMYWLCINNVAYLLDGLQSLPAQGEPYSTRQYVGFYITDIPANVMWTLNGKLYIGTIDGRVCEFYTDPNNLESYNRDGLPIEAIWETPDIDGRLFYKNKTFRYLAVRLKAASVATLEIYSKKNEKWSFIKKDSSSGRQFSFSNISFSNFIFSSDKTQKIISTKLRIKKVDKATFRLFNSELNEPFGIFDIAFEFVENGNHK